MTLARIETPHEPLSPERVGAVVAQLPPSLLERFGPRTGDDAWRADGGNPQRTGSPHGNPSRDARRTQEPARQGGGQAEGGARLQDAGAGGIARRFAPSGLSDQGTSGGVRKPQGADGRNPPGPGSVEDNRRSGAGSGIDIRRRKARGRKIFWGAIAALVVLAFWRVATLGSIEKASAGESPIVASVP